MPTPLPIYEFLKMAEYTPIIDVRSEGEFNNGHIPGAINIPIFNNEERARVGTLYKQNSREVAIEVGLEIVGPKLATLVRVAKTKIKGKDALIHCWRGGMRSGSFAWLLEMAGFKVYTLVKGYKAYRNCVLDSFLQPYSLILLGGKTGSGKTHLLHGLKDRGEQVIDLEGLCCHKGSSFGSLGQPNQPSSEQFENNLHKILMGMNANQRIWVEDESRNLGGVVLPENFYKKMKTAPLVFIDVEKEIRIKNLVEEYGCYPKDKLRASIERISKKLGGLNCKATLEALDGGRFHEVASLCLSYYDKTYLRGLETKKTTTLVKTIPLEPCNTEESVNLILAEAEKFKM